MLLNVIATVPLLIWLYLFFARGGFWRVSQHVRRKVAPAPLQQRIFVVIPARDEASGIASAVSSLLVQDLDVVVVDDNSSDGTAAMAHAAAEHLGRTLQLTVIQGKALPAGWTGKLWAISQGIDHALTRSPDYLLLTDADIQHGPHTVAQLLAIAEGGAYDLASYMVKLCCLTTAEKALIPAFVYFFFELYPPAWISSRKHRAAGAAGGCMLIRTKALQQIGGISAIRNQVIDDCALARAVKRSGGRVWLGLIEETFSSRSYGTFAEVERMIARTAFNQLSHSAWLLAGTILGLFFTYLLPPLLLLTNRRLPAALGIAAWLMMTFSYLPMIAFYRLSRFWSVCLPGIAAFYAGATIHSALRYWSGRGGQWKGRDQDVPVR